MKKILSIGLLFLFVPFAYAKAGVSITELMYDPPGMDDKHEWVEVMNTGTASLDLTKYFLQTDGVGSTYHALIAGGSNSLVPAGGYAVIVQDVATFLADHVGYSGLLFDSSWSSLSDSVGKTIVIDDSNKNVLDQYTYDIAVGANNDGSSLQKNSSGIWIPAVQTPGATNSNTAVVITATTTDSNIQNSSNTDSQAQDSVDGLPAISSGSTGIQKNTSAIPFLDVIVSRTATVGVPVNFTPSVSGISNMSSSPRTFYLSFGDGAGHVDAFTAVVSHTYTYPGTYVVTFTYRQNPYDQSTAGDLSVRKTIEVVEASVQIQSVRPDGGIEIYNPTNHEIDMSHWRIGSTVYPDLYLTIPEDTILLSGKTIIFSNSGIPIVNADTKSIALWLPSGVRVATYTQMQNISLDVAQSTIAATKVSKVKTTKVAKKSTAKKTPAQAAVVVSNKAETLSEKDIAGSEPEIVPLQAQVFSSEKKSASNNGFSRTDWIAITFGIAGFMIAGISVFMNTSLRNKIFGIRISSESPEMEKPQIAHEEEVRIIEE